MSNTLPTRHMPVKVEVLFITTHQLHFGLLQGSQLPIVVLYPSGVLLVNLVLTSMSRRFRKRLYAITGRSLNMPVFSLIGGSASFCSPLKQYVRHGDCMWLLRVCG